MTQYTLSLPLILNTGSITKHKQVTNGIPERQWRIRKATTGTEREREVGCVALKWEWVWKLRRKCVYIPHLNNSEDEQTLKKERLFLGDGAHLTHHP